MLILWLSLSLIYNQLTQEPHSVRRKSKYFVFKDTIEGNVTRNANYDMTPEGKSAGLGEKGAGVVVPFFQMTAQESGYKQHGFNLAASDMISLQRSLKDHRNYK